MYGYKENGSLWLKSKSVLCFCSGLYLSRKGTVFDFPPWKWLCPIIFSLCSFDYCKWFLQATVPYVAVFSKSNLLLTCLGRGQTRSNITLVKFICILKPLWGKRWHIFKFLNNVWINSIINVPSCYGNATICINNLPNPSICLVYLFTYHIYVCIVYIYIKYNTCI